MAIDRGGRNTGANRSRLKRPGDHEAYAGGLRTESRRYHDGSNGSDRTDKTKSGTPIEETQGVDIL